MNNDFSLGLVAETLKDEEGNFSEIKSEDWKGIYSYFTNKGYDVHMFDWKALDENLDIQEHLNGDGREEKFHYKRSNLNNTCNIVYIGQLGKIYDKADKFWNFLDYMENFDGITVNPIKTIKNNLSKQYLLDLNEKGIPAIPSKEVDSSYSLQDINDLDFDLDRKGKLEDIVLKPKVFGEKGQGVKRLSEFENEEELNDYISSFESVIAQPFLDDIEKKGENSYIFIGGEYSHGLNKRSGNFKVNLSPTTIYTPRDPSGDEKRLCEKVLSQWPDKHYYARLDLINSDTPYISEVEMVNPAGYLTETNSFERYLGKLDKKLNSLYEQNGR